MMDDNNNMDSELSKWLDDVRNHKSWKDRLTQLENLAPEDYDKTYQEILDKIRKIAKNEVIIEYWENSFPDIGPAAEAVWEGESSRAEKRLLTVFLFVLEWLVQQKKDNISSGQNYFAPTKETQEVKEELFHFVHPEIDDKEAWRVHNVVKRLVARQGIQEICSYLLQMKKDGKVLLPQSPSTAYKELVRMGMPNGEGFSEKTFMKYYGN